MKRHGQEEGGCRWCGRGMGTDGQQPLRLLVVGHVPAKGGEWCSGSQEWNSVAGSQGGELMSWMELSRALYYVVLKSAVRRDFNSRCCLLAPDASPPHPSPRTLQTTVLHLLAPCPAFAPAPPSVTRQRRSSNALTSIPPTNTAPRFRPRHLTSSHTHHGRR